MCITRERAALTVAPIPWRGEAVYQSTVLGGVS